MEKFSVQLYSLREYPLKEALDIAKDAGYTGVEFAGYEDYSAAELKKMLEDRGLEAIGSHVPHEKLRDNLAGEVAFAKELGLKSVCYPYCEMKTLEQATEVAALLDESAKAFAEVSIPLGYHNHDFEFKNEDGGSEIFLEYMMEKSSLFKLELDVYWAEFAGFNALEFAKKHRDRIFLFHFKQIGEDKKNVELADGFIDFKALKNLGEEIGVIGYVVEQEQADESTNIIDCMKRNAEFMKAL